MSGDAATATTVHPLERYYRLHARIYDASRWSFLFGRERLLRLVEAHGQPRNILEVGCGTGKNLLRLRQLWPGAKLTGLDLSAAMLAQARRKVGGAGPTLTWRHQAYSHPLLTDPPFDLLLFSYALTMFNPGWEEAIAAAAADLAPAGIMAVVDFHTSPFSLFRRWMALNHVRVAGHLLPVLENTFTTRHREIRPAYGGLWHYFLFLGQKNDRSVTGRARGTEHGPRG